MDRCGKAGISLLVPKLRLGTQVKKLRFESRPGREAELLDVRSQAELGNEMVGTSTASESSFPFVSLRVIRG
jgi:hypothetical protein